MIRTLRNVSPLLCIAVAQLFFLAQGAMLGCSFSAPISPVDDNMDHENFYTCGCRCSTPITLTRRVSAAIDDAEQTLRADDTDGAADLDLGVVLVGLRFADLAIPPGAVIISAAVQFTADQGFAGDNTTPLNLDLYAEAAANAASFGANFSNLAARPRTTASTGWIVPPWTLAQSGPAQRTSDLSAVVQEVVNAPGWQSGNALALFFAGAGGRREAESFDGNPSRAAVLEIQFSAVTDQALDVCMPPDLNPNFAHPIPTDEQLQDDCGGRVETTLTNLAMSCDYPAQCDCTFAPDSRRFNAACNDPCVEVPLDADCSNFDPTQGMTTATNAGGDLPVCAVARIASTGSGPAGLTSALFGIASECLAEGPASIDVGDESKATQARGTVEFLGQPCPGEQCAIGVALDLMLDPITFEVRFHSDPRFENLTGSGASPLDAALVGPTGFGQVEPDTIASSIRGERPLALVPVSDTRAYTLSNLSPVGVFVGWEDHVCSIFGNVAATVDDEGNQDLAAEVSLQGTIINEPPHADAGDDQQIECTSPQGATILLDGRASRDPEANAVIFTWSEGDRVGPRVGAGLLVERPQGLATTTPYVLRVIDALGQTDEDTTTVAVVDTTAPALAASGAPSVLWPPNHKLVPATVSISTADLCDPDVTIRLVSIASDEGDLANGSGHTSPDVQGALFGTDDRAFLLRAERAGPGDGRTYTITYEAEDASGNVSVGTTTVSVPKHPS